MDNSALVHCGRIWWRSCRSSTVYVDRKGENPPDKKPYYQLPIFNYYKVSIGYALLADSTTSQAPRGCRCRADSRHLLPVFCDGSPTGRHAYEQHRQLPLLFVRFL